MTDDEVYLRHILESLERIEAYTAGGREDFMHSSMAQDATVRNLEVVGEATKSLSPEIRSAHPEIPWRNMARTRDALIHDYMGVDLEIVWEEVENRLRPLRDHHSTLLEPDDIDR
ncbi:MAG TPA: DUF86 domain-containing protein [Rubrobacter sp.]|nr:DUF86 domain-containing protein [Rubrobacter sp.]